MELRAGTLADLPILAKLHADCFDAAWDVEFLGRLLAQTGAFFIFAREGNAEAGFVLARSVADEAEILSLGVMPESRRKGIASALALAAARRAQADGAIAMFLEVSRVNEAARALYARLGFAEVGRRPNYYPDLPAATSDALILRCLLPV